MGFAINTNTAANAAYRHLNQTQASAASSLEKLSSGLRINRAADDAAGLSIAEGLRSQVNGSAVAQRNAGDAISMVRTADGGLGEVQGMLQRMRDLAVQAANDSNNEDSRAALQDEAAALGAEIKRLHDGVNFNGIGLLDNSPVLSFQIGADGGAASAIEVTFPNVTGAVAGVVSTGNAAMRIDLSSHETAQTAIEKVDQALHRISEYRSEMGAAQNRFEYAVRSLAVGEENLSAAESRVRDVDMAKEMVAFTRSNILVQAGTSMLAQANQSGQGVLSLLG